MTEKLALSATHHLHYRECFGLLVSVPDCKHHPTCSQNTSKFVIYYIWWYVWCVCVYAFEGQDNSSALFLSSTRD